MSGIERPAIKMPIRGSVVAECPKCGIVCEDRDINVSVEFSYDENQASTKVSKIVRSTISTWYKDGFLHRCCNVCDAIWTDPALDSINE
jgi:hypothetical protein